MSRQEQVKSYFSERGCKLLDEYTHCMTKMKYVCSCGDEGFTSWNNFTKGKRCGKCCKTGPAKKRTLDEVRLIFQQRGCEFLDDHFDGIHFKHSYKCVCGQEGAISFAGFYHQDQLCKQCGIKKKSGANNHEWKPDREGHRLDQLFRKKCYKALRTTLQRTEQRKTRRTHELLGYTHQQLREHIEKHPRWEELKDGPWHLDHIFPIQAFLDHGIRDTKLINRLDNLQPLPGDENIVKHDNYDQEEFEKWLGDHK